jgi:hypothetical protein
MRGQFATIACVFFVAASTCASCLLLLGEAQAMVLEGCMFQVGRIAASDTFACAIRGSDSGVTCWGDTNIPGIPMPPTGAFRVIGGYGTDPGNRACGCRSDNTVACWGSNSHGESAPPTGVEMYEVALGPDYTCGLKLDNSVTCWGTNGYGGMSPPQGLFSDLVAGGTSGTTCGNQEGYGLTCWGYNGAGQATPPTSSLISGVSIGAEFACGLRPDNTIVCWGAAAPTPPTGKFIRISAGTYHACAIKLEDSTIVCWGDDTYGQLEVPVGPFSEVDSGAYYSCAIRATDGAVVCWGNNTLGQTTPPSDIFSQCLLVLTGTKIKKDLPNGGSVTFGQVTSSGTLAFAYDTSCTARPWFPNFVVESTTSCLEVSTSASFDSNTGVQVCIPLPASPPTSLAIEQCDPVGASPTCPQPGADPRVNVGPLPSPSGDQYCCGLQYRHYQHRSRHRRCGRLDLRAFAVGRGCLPIPICASTAPCWPWT